MHEPIANLLPHSPPSPLTTPFQCVRRRCRKASNRLPDQDVAKLRAESKKHEKNTLISATSLCRRTMCNEVQVPKGMRHEDMVNQFLDKPTPLPDLI